ncbi:MAG: hypothetical protein KIG81_11600 [Thermoguttaceae bacterium]|nr:hypothetical protein [Thermoguttaceae bacterium]
MNNDVTELVLILDRSGSMSSCARSTVDCFNDFIEKQKQENSGAVYVSVVLFNQGREVLYNRVGLYEVRPLTVEEFRASGGTALYDALASGIHHIGKAYKYARPDEAPGKTIFVVITDGAENSSRLYTLEETRKMVEREIREYGWEFLFFGANLRAKEVAQALGFKEENAVDYICDEIGSTQTYDALNSFVSEFRKEGRVSSDWRGGVDRDYQTRKKSR